MHQSQWLRFLGWGGRQEAQSRWTGFEDKLSLVAMTLYYQSDFLTCKDENSKVGQRLEMQH